jgi:hypothetical protein
LLHLNGVVQSGNVALKGSRPPTNPPRVLDLAQACSYCQGGFQSTYLNEEWTLPIMSTRFHFLYRIDMWSSDDAKVIEHLAGVEDFKVAMATYRAACERWPGRTITLSQGARVIESPIRMRQEAIA